MLLRAVYGAKLRVATQFQARKNISRPARSTTEPSRRREQRERADSSARGRAASAARQRPLLEDFTTWAADTYPGQRTEKHDVRFMKDEQGRNCAYEMLGRVPVKLACP
jgi:hypothetical protein